MDENQTNTVDFDDLLRAETFTAILVREREDEDYNVFLTLDLTDATDKERELVRGLMKAAQMMLEDSVWLDAESPVEKFSIMDKSWFDSFRKITL